MQQVTGRIVPMDTIGSAMIEVTIEPQMKIEFEVSNTIIYNAYMSDQRLEREVVDQLSRQLAEHIADALFKEGGMREQLARERARRAAADPVARNRSRGREPGPSL